MKVGIQSRLPCGISNLLSLQTRPKAWSCRALGSMRALMPERVGIWRDDQCLIKASVLAGHAVPDDSESDYDSDDSRSRSDLPSRRNLEADSVSSAGGMAIPDQEPRREPREKAAPKPDFGTLHPAGPLEIKLN